MICARHFQSIYLQVKTKYNTGILMNDYSTLATKNMIRNCNGASGYSRYSLYLHSTLYVFTLMPLCLVFYVLELHVYLIHEHHQIPYDKPHRLGEDGNCGYI
jgi:hypothetical protein